jgi:hypothetical protein
MALRQLTITKEAIIPLRCRREGERELLEPVEGLDADSADELAVRITQLT